MARSIQQIKQDIAALEDTVATVAVELHRIYTKYLELLSQSAKKQLILASYQICTQEYPDLFLNLSLSQKQTLQQNLRQLGKQIQPQLLSYLPRENGSEASSNSDFLKYMLSKLQVEREGEEEQEQQMLPIAATEGVDFLDINEKESKTNNPEDLIDWHKQIQQGINKTLENITKEANRLLEEAKVIPQQLPAKVVEMAMQAEEAGSQIGGSPNMLNLLIETGNDEQSSDSKLTKVVAIRLRLSEIEFSDPSLSAEGNQIRNLLSSINKIRQQYQRKQRECAIAEAEAAWRSTWFED